MGALGRGAHEAPTLGWRDQHLSTTGSPPPPHCSRRLGQGLLRRDPGSHPPESNSKAGGPVPCAPGGGQVVAASWRSRVSPRAVQRRGGPSVHSSRYSAPAVLHTRSRIPSPAGSSVPVRSNSHWHTFLHLHLAPEVYDASRIYEVHCGVGLREALVTVLGPGDQLIYLTQTPPQVQVAGGAAAGPRGH